MKIGAVFPQTEIGNDPGIIREWAQTAEGLGYADIVVYDHVLGAEHAGRDPKLWGPYTEETPFHEVFVLLGYLAAVTTTVELVTGVLILPQRQTALVAKQAAEIDVLSEGRMRLGVGTGWNYVEYDSLNEDFHNRGKRQEEQVELLRTLWTAPVIDYTGQWHRVERAGILPLPPHAIPIWWGGFGDVAYRRAARLADGFIFGASVKDAIAGIERTRSFLTEEGRDPAAFGFEVFANWHAGPDRWRRDLDALRGVGADYVTMRSMNGGLAGREHLDTLRTWAAAVQ